jgi:VCBS repeat protein
MPLVLVALAALAGGAMLASCGSGQGVSRLSFVERSASFLPDDHGLGGRAIEIGDVTGDGEADLVLGYGSGVAVWSRLGASLFRPQASVLLPPAPDGVAELRLADLDGDENLDIALITGRGDLALWIRRARGSFFDETSRRLLGLTAPGSLTMLKVVDLDRDGAPDLFLSGASGTQILMNRSGGLFREPAGLPLPLELARQTDTRDAVFADFDGDGNLDVAVDLSDQIEILRGQSDGSFQLDRSAVLVQRAGRPSRIVLADVDGDGDLDIIASGAATASSNGGHELLVNDGRGHFSDASLTSLPRSAAATFDVLAADIDLDGHVDLIFATATGVELFLNDGTGRFEDETRLLPVLGPVLRLRTYDIDGDRDLDILATRPADRTALLLNELDPGPAPTATPTPTATPEPTPSPTP